MKCVLACVVGLRPAMLLGSMVAPTISVGIELLAPAAPEASSTHVVAEEHARVLLQITSALAASITEADVHVAIVERVAMALSASTCALWVCDGEVLRLARQVGYHPDSEKRFAAVPVDVEPPIPFVDAFRQRQPVWIPNQRALFAQYPHLRGATYREAYRIACLPLVTEDKVLGTLALTLENQAESSESERSFLLLVARYATLALERLRIVDAERRSRARADAIARRMTILGQASRDFGDLDVENDQRLDRIVRRIGSVLGASTTIALVEDDDLQHIRATYHPSPDAEAESRVLAARHPLPASEGLSGEVRRSGRAVLLPSVDPEMVRARAPESYREFFERFPIYAVMIVPLRARGKIIGAISAVRTEPGQTFEHDDLELFEGLADRAAAAIETNRLAVAAEAARRRAEHMYRFATAAVNAESLAQVFDAGLEAIAHTLEGQRAAILLFDDEDVLRFRAWRGLSERYRRAVDGHSPWARDARDPQPVVVGDCLRDPAWNAYSDTFRAEGIAALAFIPLIGRGRLVGKFMVYYDAPRSFAPEELEVASAIANHLASTIGRFHALSAVERTLRDNELFAGVLAHDLRNPLAAIVTATEVALFQNDGADERTRKPLTRVLSAAGRMKRMIEQLLDFTRARVGGGIEIHRQAGNLIDLVRQVVGELELVHPDAELRITTRGDAEGSWDHDRLAQVVSNLVGNACSHGAPGHPIAIEIDGSDPRRVTLSVHNAGGIPAELLPQLFDPFRSGAKRFTRQSGLGLGLYIVSEIVRAHHGRVHATSTMEAGTRFQVDLPRT